MQQFEQHLSILKDNFTVVEGRSLRFSEAEAAAIETFISQSSLRDGRFSFRYLTSAVSHVVSPLQFYKRCSVVIGMVEGTDDIEINYSTLSDYVESLKGVMVWRLLSFNPVSPQNFQADRQVRYVFYQDAAELPNHFQVIMEDIAVELAVNIATEAKHIKTSSDSVRLSHESDSLVSQKRHGRALKAYGEFALMLGCSIDAGKFLLKAMLLLKEHKDYLFLGSTIDSFASLKLSFSDDGPDVNLIPEALDEASHYYQLGVCFDLVAESKLKTAKYYAKIALKVEAVKLLDNFYKAHFNHLLYSDQLDFVDHVVQFCHQHDFKRKASYYSIQGYKLASKMKDYVRAKAFLLECVSSYQVEELAIREAETQPEADRREPSAVVYYRRENLRPWVRGQPAWLKLQQFALRELIQISRTLNSRIDTLKYRILKLQLLRNSLSEAAQLRLINKIEADAAALSDDNQLVEVSMPFHPILLKVEPQQSERQSHTAGLGNHLSLLKEDKYFAHKVWDSDLNWTQGNIETVHVCLQNTYAYDINVTTIHVCVEGGDGCPGIC